jgi:hypothetical protein
VPGFVRAFRRHAGIVGLFLREFGQLHANVFEVQASDFFVQLFGQKTDANLIGVAVGADDRPC